MPRKYTLDPYYDTPEWRDLRRATLQRDKHRCHYCGERAHQADHVIPRWKGGPDHLDNLVACCVPCNRAAGGTVFSCVEDKTTWILAHRGKKRWDPPPAAPPRAKVPVAIPKRLTGLRKRLARKHQPAHIVEALLLQDDSP